MRRALPLLFAGAMLLVGGYALAGLDVTPVVPDLSGLARKSDLPTAGSTMPPGTDVNGAVGSDASQYARRDHTHATSVQRMRMAVSPAGQPVRWTFGKPYDAGVVPVVTCTAENTATATRPFVVNTVTAPTNTYVDLIVFQATAPALSLGNLSLTLFGSASTGTLVNCQAAKPTQ